MSLVHVATLSLRVTPCFIWFSRRGCDEY